MFFLEKTQANVPGMITYGGMELCFRSCKYFYQRRNRPGRTRGTAKPRPLGMFVKLLFEIMHVC
jgi:hypothetical protein